MNSSTMTSAHRVVRELVLVGEDDDPLRRGDKRVIAMSNCRFACPDKGTLRRCVAAIRKSDEHLRNRPEEMMLWDWQSTFVEMVGSDLDDAGATVILGVAWYDEDFFREKREAHLDSMHRTMYEAIGLPPGSIEVTHWRCEGQTTL